MDYNTLAIFIITFIIMFAISYYIIIVSWPTTTSITALNAIQKKKAFSLSSDQVIGVSSSVAEPFFTGSGGSLVFYVYLTSAQRTSDINNPYMTVVGIPGSFALQVASHGDARIVVETATKSGAKTEEIVLPGLAKQKWIQVAIIREGRRFDIVYNEKIVASHRLKYLPVVRISPLRAGQDGLQGTIGNIRVSSRRVTIQELVTEYKRTSDTRGKPYLDETIGISSMCPSGQPCPSTSESPQNTLQFWSSPYR
jgi:hypothetical protein